VKTLKGWRNESRRHSLASRGIKTINTKRIKTQDVCQKPLPVYRGFKVEENKPIDLRDLTKNGWWTTDSRVAMLFGADPNNSKLQNDYVLNIIENYIERTIDNDKVPDPKWLEDWLDYISDDARTSMEWDNFSIILKGNIKKGDKIKRESSMTYFLEQEVYAEDNLDVLEIGYMDIDSDLRWIDYNDVPEYALKNSDEFRLFMYEKAKFKEEDDEIPKALLMYLTGRASNHENKKLVDNIYEDVIMEDNFWKYQCDTLPKYENMFDEFIGDID